MEYYVQRHGSLAAFSYSIMSAALAVIAAAVITMTLLIPKAKRRSGKDLRKKTDEKSRIGVER